MLKVAMTYATECKKKSTANKKKETVLYVINTYFFFQKMEVL